MTTSKTIAGLIGPTLVAIAAGMLLNIGSFPELAEQVSRDPALILSGLTRMLFPTGLAAIAGGIGQTTGAIIPGAIVLLGLGAFLSFKAYRRD